MSASTAIASSAGPLALADAGRVRQILTESGYDEVLLESVDEPVKFGRDPDDAFAFISSIGFTQGPVEGPRQRPVPSGAGQHPSAARRAGTTDGVLLGSSTWLVAARVPE